MLNKFHQRLISSSIKKYWCKYGLLKYSIYFSSNQSLSNSPSYTQPFRILNGNISTQSTEFKENYAAMELQIKDLNELNSEIIKGGPNRYVEKHIASGKYMVRDRISGLLDAGSPFLELSSLAGFKLYTEPDKSGDGSAVKDMWLPAAGIVCGIGKIHGNECMIVANDATVKGGAYLPITVTKHLRAQEIAQQCNIPCIYVVDSGGAFLPKQAEVFPSKEHFGRIFYNQAQMSSLKIPQISLVLGSCTAGGAYIPAMSDENVIVRKQGTIFLGGPPLVMAATGETVTEEELGGADVHCFISGVSDHYAENDAHALQIGRNIIQNLNIMPAVLKQIVGDIEPPKFDIDDILGLIPKDKQKMMDQRQIIARIVDGSKFDEFKCFFGQTLITGFARIYGVLVGIIANNGVLFSDSAQKGAHFIEICSQRNIPLIFLQNISGFMVGKDQEHSGIAKHGAKMVTAVACANVPKITILTGGSFGAGNYGMCGRAFNPNFLFMWANSRISVMSGDSASTVLWIIKENQRKEKRNKYEDMNDAEKKSYDEEKKIFCDPILQQYEYEGHPYFSSSRIWDDGVIDPRDTRKVLHLCLNASMNAPQKETKFGVFRM